jgi:hypothetical protein
LANITELVILELAAADDHQIEGSKNMAHALGYRNDTFVVRKLRECEGRKLIEIIRGRRGRGHKTVYRLNRNSPGSRRKVRS